MKPPKRKLKWSVTRIESGKDYTVISVCGKWMAYLWRGLNVNGEWAFRHNTKAQAMKFCERHARERKAK